MSTILDRKRALTKEEFEEYRLRLIQTLSETEIGEIVAYELRQLLNQFVSELASAPTPIVYQYVRGKIDGLVMFATHLGQKTHLAEMAQEPEIEKGARRWTPSLSDGDSLIG